MTSDEKNQNPVSLLVTRHSYSSLSPIAFQDERNQFQQPGGCRPQGSEDVPRLAGRAVRPGVGFRRSRESRGTSICRGRRPSAPVCPVAVGVAFHVEQIIGDLERQSQTTAVASRRSNVSRRRPIRRHEPTAPRAGGWPGSGPRSCGRVIFRASPAPTLAGPPIPGCRRRPSIFRPAGQDDVHGKKRYRVSDRAAAGSTDGVAVEAVMVARGIRVR